MQLYNKLSANDRARIIDKSSQERITLSFYKYFKLRNPVLFRDNLYIIWAKLDILGRIYVANEGINAQISVPKENINKFRATLQDIIPLSAVKLNFALEHYSKSFLKLTIKIRKKIVADGLDDNTFDVTNIGEHLDAENFNKMLDDENTVCIDMRNHYESEIGFFRGAIKPDVDTFRQSLERIDNELEKNGPKKNYLMYCTGGIRCEKASIFLKNKGFKNVFQLKGGILNYLNKTEKKDSLWKGECFVFDNRISLKHKLKQGSFSMCSGCRTPLSVQDKKSNKYEEGVSCSRCYDTLTSTQKSRFRMRQSQINVAKKSGKKHKFQKEY